jgi:hypothetical protein
MMARVDTVTPLNREARTTARSFFFPLSLYSGGGQGWGFFAFLGEHAIALFGKLKFA